MWVAYFNLLYAGHLWVIEAVLYLQEPWVLGVLVVAVEAYRPMYDRCCGNSYLAAAGGGWRVIWTNYNPDTQSSTRRSLSRPGWREH